MWIKFVKPARANERTYNVDDTALFQDALGQQLIDEGFAKPYDPAEDAPKAVKYPEAETVAPVNPPPAEPEKAKKK